MALFIVAGVPQPIAIRHKGYKPDIPGWDVYFCHSRSNSADLKTCLPELLTIADSAGDEGVHVAAFHSHAESERPVIREKFYSRHRLIWLHSSLLSSFGNDHFTEALTHVVAFEDDWRDGIRPSSVGSPLMLPETVFIASKECRQLWKRADQVQMAHDGIADIRRLMLQFRLNYLTKDVWVDEHRRSFNPNGSRHADHLPSGRCWKYTYKIPKGFHFDVESVGARAEIIIQDADGRVHRFGSYTNVDCHGFVRDGR
jgi:hypothetical protein